jgi:hypothetical protein
MIRFHGLRFPPVEYEDQGRLVCSILLPELRTAVVSATVQHEDMNKRFVNPAVVLFMSLPPCRSNGTDENPHTHQEGFPQEFAIGRAAIVAVTSASATAGSWIKAL